jgi:hypothetical protein
MSNRNATIEAMTGSWSSSALDSLSGNQQEPLSDLDFDTQMCGFTAQC